jgi:co-chaperonin GroES (HSP10)
LQIKSFRPTKGKIFVTEMEQGMRTSAGGIILTADEGSEKGIRPRWGKVAILGEGIDYVAPGEWVLVEHGRWTTKIPLEIEGEEPLDVWMIDPAAILVVSDTPQKAAEFKP